MAKSILSDDALRKSQLSSVKDIKTPRDAGYVNAIDKELIRRGYSREAKGVIEASASPLEKLSYLKKIGKFTKYLPVLGAVATGIGALGYSDLAGAATDMVTGPVGGVEEMGVSPEQKDLDIAYLNKIRQMNQRKK